MNHLIADEVGTFDPKQIIKFSPADAAIKKMEAEFLPLKINGASDSAGFKAVHEARMIVKQHRVSVEKKRKELKADALEFGRKVDAEAKRIMGLMEPIEGHLQAEEDAYNAEKERLKKAEEERRQRIVDERLEKLTLVGWVGNPSFVAIMDDETFDGFLDIQETAHKRKLEEAAAAEAERIRAEKEEADRRAAERAELDRQRKELEAEQARLAEERRQQEAEAKAERDRLEAIRQQQQAEAERIEAEKRKAEKIEAERLHKAEVEKARLEAAEKARQEELDRQERERVEAERIAQEQQLERERIEAMRPDRERLLDYLSAVESVAFPEVSKAMKREAGIVKNRLATVIKELRNELEDE